MTSEGEVRLCDFGLAGVVGEIPEVIGGTMDYMAPEHRTAFESRKAGKKAQEIPPLTDKADVFSLGVIYFEMACGEHPARSVRTRIRRRAAAVSPRTAVALRQDPGHRAEASRRALP